MISRIEGELIAVTRGRAEVQHGPLVYELLIPAIDTQRLATMVGQTISFHTLHYMESLNQGAAFLPRLIGFQSPEDRAFFELFTTVRGMGNRKALRALEMPFADIAGAIAEKDIDLLKSLPEIGKRTAETIIAELREKVDRFIEVKGGVPGSGPAGDGRSTEASALARDAIAVLVQLGESRLAARQLVDRALVADPSLETPDQLVAAAFQLKER